MKIANFYFELTDGSDLKLSYRLQPNSLSDRWTQQVMARKLEHDTSFNLKIANKDRSDLPDLMAKLNSIIDYINSIYDKELPKFTNLEEIDHSTLNYLHQEFEEYGERNDYYSKNGTYWRNNVDNWYEKPFNLKFHEAWLSLNEWIHITETASETDLNESQYSCLIQYYPFYEGEKVSNIDKLFLTTDFQWGHLYLGYNTLGKDYMHTAEHNDVRVVTNNQVKVQEYFSTEVFLNFCSSRFIFHQKKQTELQFYQWYISQPKEVQDLVPINDRNKLSLGLYYLGSLMFTDTFMSYCDDYDAWDKNINNIHHKWNQEVFSQIVKVKNIEIENGNS